MNTKTDELRARLQVAWKDKRLLNMPHPHAPGNRVVGYVIEWDESFPLMPSDIIAALARQEEGREAVDREAVLREYVEDYEFLGETEDGRDACYQPNERERLLIEDALRGWEALELPKPAPASPQGVSDAVPLPPRCFIGLGLLKGAKYEFGKVYDSPDGEFIRWADFEKYRAALTAAGAAPEGLSGELVEMGDDDEGQPRLVIHTTREAIKASNLCMFRSVGVRMLAATPNPGAQHGQEGRDG